MVQVMVGVVSSLMRRKMKQEELQRRLKQENMDLRKINLTQTRMMMVLEKLVVIYLRLLFSHKPPHLHRLQRLAFLQCLPQLQLLSCFLVQL
ncbi:hypothetical protein HPP92_020000 [Vanilla planifolia]|uniref:Uncharacterized protein n=1 Tax=Vanilla planifolia TaxID=51239 RepID=A0A835ULN0_VANPL|nr:hypothetical protein HPP92_020000 [Vanilla planifolia]